MNSFPEDNGRLPVPEPAALEHSRELLQLIHREIQNHGGAIDFQRFMELALYAPGLGYYRAGTRKFGQGGDFVTAPELSALFSRCLARQCREILVDSGDAILELGAGSGIMAATLLGELQRLRALPEAYLILELSGELRERQQRLLEARLPALLPRVRWLDSLPRDFHGVILANEVLDALPVSRFRITETGPRPLRVTLLEQTLGWQEGPADTGLNATMDTLQHSLAQPLPVGYESEFCPGLSAWIESLGAALARGALLLVDYGYPRREYYHTQRHRGTLLCHYRHRVHDDPFLWPGLQDITASVDFTAVAEAALAADLTVAGYTSQANFLLGCGLTELLAEADPDNQPSYLKLAREAKILTLPGEMGDRFQAMLLTRGLQGTFRGFGLRDDRHRL